MQEKLQNRKIILQQLLQKSQLFSTYLKNQQNTNSIMNISTVKRNQILQFGKCKISLPQKQKVKVHSQKFSNSKIVVLTNMNNKQAKKIIQKYENLNKLKQSQNLSIGLTNTKSERKQVKSLDIVQNQNQHLNQQQNEENLLQFQRGEQSSFQYKQNNLNLAAKDITNGNVRQFSFKSRSNSAKVRPQFDLFLKSTCGNKKKNEIIPRRYNSAFKQKINYGQINQKQINLNLTMRALRQHSKKLAIQGGSQLQRHRIENYANSLANNSSYNRKPHSSSFSVKKYANPSHSSMLSPLPLKDSKINKNFQMQLQQQKRQKIHFRRELHKQYNKAFIPPPKISAKSYTVYQLKRETNEMQKGGKILATINGKNAQQIASLTKIMTCIIVLEIVDKFCLKLEEIEVEIGKFETNVTGTSAHIKQGEIYTVEQLLFGLMLPSGNDASLVLGIWGGKILIQNDLKYLTQRTKENSQNNYPAYQDKQPCQRRLHKKDYICRFLEQMNFKAYNLGMTKTNYANTHGLVNCQSKSSAIDMVFLCQYAMENAKFKQIVSTKIYTSRIKYKEKSKSLGQRQISFENTHLLLHKKPQQYLGIKTGVTTSAGPCLASCIQHKQTLRKFIIIVLGCKSMKARFKQTQILRKWLYRQEGLSVGGNIDKTRQFSKKRSMSLKQQKSLIDSERQQTQINSEGQQQDQCEDKVNYVD